VKRDAIGSVLPAIVHLALYAACLAVEAGMACRPHESEAAD